MTWATTDKDEKDYSIAFENTIIRRVGRDEGFKVLGTILTFNAHFDVEIERRIRAAKAAFARIADVLCCKDAPLGRRLDLLNRVVGPALFWCAGSWNLSTANFERLVAQQRAFVRRMCCFEVRPNESAEFYFRRTNTVISNILEDQQVLPWDVRSRREVFRWAGWVARLQVFDPSRLTYWVAKHKDLSWLAKIKAWNRGRELHGHYFRPWRWETIIFNFFRENSEKLNDQTWHQVALDTPAWNAIVNNLM